MRYSKPGMGWDGMYDWGDKGKKLGLVVENDAMELLQLHELRWMSFAEVLHYDESSQCCSR